MVGTFLAVARIADEVRSTDSNYAKARPKAVAVENIPSNLVLPMKKAVVRDYMTETQVRNDEKVRVWVFKSENRR